jgi:catechol 2,3-dioxygenase-like lactoylglutathione lyase family enzyme
MITGAHIIIYSKDPEADRKFFRDILKFSAVDAGHGWLIFALPPAEAAFHPDEKNDRHELYFMCDDLKSTMESLQRNNVKLSAVKQERWGILTELTLPGGGRIGLYQPKHPTAIGSRP